MTALDLDDLISEVEAAEVLRQKPETLTQWRHREIGPEYFKVGRRVFYSKSALVAYIAAQRVIPANALATS
jgi:hypothetical protein